MSLFGPKYISISEAEINANELFTCKQVTRPNKRTVVVVPANYNAILVKDGEYINILPEGKHYVVSKGEKGIKLELIYVSKTKRVEVKWATASKFDMCYDGKNIKIGIRGAFSVGAIEPRKAFLEFVGSDYTFNQENLQNKLRARICSEIQPIAVKALCELGVAHDEFQEKCVEVAHIVKLPFAETLKRDYGLALYEFAIDAINVE